MYTVWVHGPLPYKALRTHILRLSGLKTRLCKVFGPFRALGLGLRVYGLGFRSFGISGSLDHVEPVNRVPFRRTRHGVQKGAL